MSAISPQTIANELSDKILAYDSESIGAEFELAQIRRGIDKLKLVDAKTAYLLEGFYYTYCQPHKERAMSVIEKSLRLDSSNPTHLANAGTVYRAWGELDLSCDLYADAFVKGNVIEIIDTLASQSFINANLDEVYPKIETMLKNSSGKVVSDFLRVYRQFSKVDKNDLLFFKDKLVQVLGTFKKDISEVAIVDLDDKTSFVSVAVKSKSIDEALDMNAMLEDLVIDSLEKSPSNLTVNYSFILK